MRSASTLAAKFRDHQAGEDQAADDYQRGRDPRQPQRNRVQVEDGHRDGQQENSCHVKKGRDAEEDLVASRRRDQLEKKQQPGLYGWLISASSPWVVLIDWQIVP